MDHWSSNVLFKLIKYARKFDNINAVSKNFLIKIPFQIYPTIRYQSKKYDVTTYYEYINSYNTNAIWTGTIFEL